jgi:hypothetical protein
VSLFMPMHPTASRPYQVTDLELERALNHSVSEIQVEAINQLLDHVASYVRNWNARKWRSQGHLTLVMANARAKFLKIVPREESPSAWDVCTILLEAAEFNRGPNWCDRPGG